MAERHCFQNPEHTLVILLRLVATSPHGVLSYAGLEGMLSSLNTLLLASPVALTRYRSIELMHMLCVMDGDVKDALIAAGSMKTMTVLLGSESRMHSDIEDMAVTILHTLARRRVFQVAGDYNELECLADTMQKAQSAARLTVCCVTFTCILRATDSHRLLVSHLWDAALTNLLTNAPDAACRIVLEEMCTSCGKADMRHMFSKPAIISASVMRLQVSHDQLGSLIIKCIVCLSAPARDVNEIIHMHQWWLGKMIAMVFRSNEPHIAYLRGCIKAARATMKDTAASNAVLAKTCRRVRYMHEQRQLAFKKQLHVTRTHLIQSRQCTRRLKRWKQREMATRKNTTKEELLRARHQDLECAVSLLFAPVLVWHQLTNLQLLADLHGCQRVYRVHAVHASCVLHSVLGIHQYLPLLQERRRTRHHRETSGPHALLNRASSTSHHLQKKQRLFMNHRTRCNVLSFWTL